MTDSAVRYNQVQSTRMSDCGPLPDFACPRCRSVIMDQTFNHPFTIRCTRCRARYKTDPFGYANLTTGDASGTLNVDTTTAAYAHSQHTAYPRRYAEFLRPYVQSINARLILDVACGIGEEVEQLRSDGFDAYGIDLPSLGKLWDEAGRSRCYFFESDASALPFPDDTFDLTLAQGVIEHIGTVDGEQELSSEYREARRAFACELMRVTRPGGHILVTCPNKRFPLDIQHSPRRSERSRVVRFFWARTGVVIHRPWGPNHLLSYGELRQLFEAHGATSRPLAPCNYFGFGRFRRGFLRPFREIARLYLNGLPRALWGTAANPYVISEIHKKGTS